MKKPLAILAGLLLAWSSNAQTFTEDFTPQNTWTQVNTGISITGGQARYNNCSGASSRRIHTNHNLTLTNNWMLEFEFQFTAVGSSGPGHHLASLTAGTLDPVSTSAPWTPTNQDAIAMMFYSTNASNTPSTFQLVGCSKNDNNAWVNSTGIVLAQGKTYYLRLERLDDTHARISAFLDAAHTVHENGSPQCFNLSAGITNNLNVLQHGNTSWAFSGRSLTGYIDNTELTNYSVTETVAGDQQICSGTGDPVAFTSSATSNNPNNTYEWQYSTNGGVTWIPVGVGGNGLTYDPPAGITQNTLYRRVTTHTTCGDQHISNTITVTVVTCNALSCDFSTDFSSGAGWTTVGTATNIGAGTFNYNNTPGQSQNRMFTNHGVTMTNSWRLDFDFRFTGVGSWGPGHHLASLTAGTNDPVSTGIPTWATPTNQDAVAAMFYSTNHTTDPSTFELVGSSKNDANAWVMSQGIVLTQGVQYFITLERLDQTHGRISVFTNAARTTHAAGSPQCFTIDAGVTANLNVLQHGNTSWASQDRALTGTIDNDCLSLLNFSAGTIGIKNPNANCGSAPGTIQTTSPASGPNNFYTFTYQWEVYNSQTLQWNPINFANGITYQPPALYQTTQYRRVAIGPCGMRLISNVVTINVTLNAALNSDFSSSVNCQSGQANFSVTSTAFVNSGTNFLGTWTITDITAGTPPVSLVAWNNVSPCSFPGHVFVQGHVYEIVRTVKDDCTEQGSTLHTVTCMAGMATHDGRVIVEETENMSNGLITPNPSSGIFVVDTKDMNASAISIYNTQGKLIRTVAINDDAVKTQFDLTDQPAGMYLATIYTANGLITHKIVKE